MKCAVCGQSMFLVATETKENEVVQSYVCVNSRCANYSGRNLNNTTVNPVNVRRKIDNNK